jgi:hypothetical protein
MLTQARLIRARKSGRERIYELAPSGGAELMDIIEHLRDIARFWDVALDSFKRYAEQKR